MNEPNLIKEEDRDGWYRRMGERTDKNPNDYPSCSSIEFVDYMVEYSTKSKID
jgi:hypothetical protein